MPVVLLVLVVGVVWAVRRRQGGERARSAEVGAVGWAPGTNWRVLAPLARADARRLARHPAFVAGVVLTPLMFSAAMGGARSWWQRSPSMALALVPLGWCTIVAANLLALKPRRAGVDELFAAAPAPQPLRTTALLAGGSVAVAAAVALSAGWLLWSAATLDGAVGSPRLAEIGAGVLIVAGALAVGVAVARWLPHFAFGLLAVFAVTFLQARFMDPTTWPWNTAQAHPGRFLGFLASTTSAGVAALEFRPAGWHAAYLAGLVLLMAAVALARDGVPRPLAAVFAAAAVLVASTGWVQTRPPSDRRVAAMAAYLTDPRSSQRCTESGLTTYCAYEEHRDQVAGWTVQVEAVRALLPPAVAGRRLAVTDRVPTVTGNSACGPKPYLDGVHREVAAAVAPAAVWPEDGQVHPGTDRSACGGLKHDDLFTALQVGSWAVGLPPGPHGLDIRCDAAGQARAVVALWLAGVATPDGARFLRDVAGAEGSGPLTFAGWSDPPMLGAVFHADDVRRAVALLDLPVERVRAVLHEHWAELTDPATPSSAVSLAVSPAGTDPPAPPSPHACR
ncbi:MAG TPA: hypothetical protein VFJ85_09395 [Acidimicrobiales bacterium]|nr:hypothetical protein [Acidimicrobiales bacterium]